MKKLIKEGELIRSYHDEDCPLCGFPETVITSRLVGGTLQPISIECSKKCGFKKNYD